MDRVSSFDYLIRFLTFLVHIIISVIIVFLNNLNKLIFSTKSKKIKGQIVLVTGGANGLGKEICIQLAKKGCNIAIADIDLENAINISNILKNDYRIVSKAYKVDVSVYQEIQQLKVDIEKDLGPVDIIVSNAALLSYTSTLFEKSPDDITKLLNINILPIFWLSKVFLKDMIQRKQGHIVAVSSTAGLFAPPVILDYGVSKHAIEGFMKGLQNELNLLNVDKYIKTTIIRPYFMATNDKVEKLASEQGCLYYLPVYSIIKTAERLVLAIQKDEKEVAVPKVLNFLLIISKYLTRETLDRITSYLFKITVKYYENQCKIDI